MIMVETMQTQRQRRKKLTQEGKMNVEIIIRIMTEKKNTCPSLRNKDW